MGTVQQIYYTLNLQLLSGTTREVGTMGTKVYVATRLAPTWSGTTREVGTMGTIGVFWYGSYIAMVGRERPEKSVRWELLSEP